ncbi:hypothetical protein [Luteolibacter sp. Populi]|uniref:pilus assembly PilX family protein n=1 Tax=Luteolibacter sp. Populi TaxID=3230487 RepID=UPI0034659D87
MNGRKTLQTQLRSKNPGFALVITLSLMVLLTILAVGLLSLSTISLRSSTREDAMATARANARMALMLAIGDLQKQAGPDQRVTGTADLAGGTDGSRLGTGAQPGNNTAFGGGTKGLTSVQPGSRYWTGVWNNTNTSNPGETIYTTPPRPAFRKWLISGNHGRISPENTITPAINSVAVGGNGQVADSERAIVLVGQKTIGDTSPESLDRFVSAPMVELGTESTRGNIPGRATRGGLATRE